MTNEELADTLGEIARLLTVREPSFTVDDTCYEAARRLREQGERIEGGGAPDIGGHGHDSIFRKWEDVEFIEKGLLVPATLIIPPQEPESDG